MSLAQEFENVGRKKTHRGRRSQGFGAKPQEPADGKHHHEAAKAEIKVALAEQDPKKAHAHLFKAISSLNKACK